MRSARARPGKGGLGPVLALLALVPALGKAAPPEEHAAPAEAELTVAVGDEGRLTGTAGRTVVSGTTNAPAGSRVRVTIGDRAFPAEVGADGGWRLRWPLRLESGEHQVRVVVETFDGRAAAAIARLEVEPDPRLPRRGPETPTVYAPDPASESDDFLEQTDRWRLVPPPYELDAPAGRWNPYNQNVLKGDFPIRGQHVFLILTAISDSLLEGRSLPTPAGVSTREPRLEFFGGSDQGFAVPNLFFSTELYRGDTAFRPPDWRLKATIAANLNYLEVKEQAVVHPDVRRGVTRTDEHFVIQELFAEKKLAEWSPNYDFFSVRVGIQPFNSDFRGFVFSDTNLGVRFFGNWGSNRNQFNLAFFDRLEKDTNSGLNTFDSRGQQVVIANFYRQDFLARGFTAEWSLHYLRDEPSFHFDTNGFLVRPDPAGDLTPHEIEALYLGWASFGHIGRLNLDTAFYYVTGDDSRNPLAGRQLVERDGELVFDDEVDIGAWMAAVELSMDRDWLRPKLAFFWASGDDDLNDRDARGFDAIFENPNFAGGGFSFWNRLGIRLAGSGVALVQRGSLLPSLKTSKDEGQPNFVNPGIQLASLGLDVEVTPKIKATTTLNYLRFDKVEVLEGILFQGPLDEELGWDLSVGLRYRPWLNENFVFVGGAALFSPGRGFEQIYEDPGELYQVFGNVILTF